MKIRHYLIAVIVTTSSVVEGQSFKGRLGLPIIQNFSTSDYYGGIQNYDILEDYRGLIYVANNLGMLEYDGTSWKKYSTDKTTKVRSVYSHHSGKLFVGAQNEIGFFFPDKKGTFNFHSLNHLIPKEHLNFDDIWKIYPYKNGCVFASLNKIFLYNDNQITVIPLDNSPGFIFLLDETIVTQFYNVGLSRLTDHTWGPMPYSGFFKEKQVSSIFKLSNDLTIVSTRNSGLYSINQGVIVPWATGLLEKFKKDKINTCLRLSTGDVAIGTNAGGLYIVNSNGELIKHFTKGRGLMNRSVLAIHEDSFGNIWAGLNNGISKIEWNSPFSFINEEVGLQGTGYVAHLNDKTIYYGTNNGLFKSKTTLDSAPNSIEKIYGIEGQVYNIQSVSGATFVAAHNGAYVLESDKIVNINNDTGWWTFISTEDPNIIIGGAYNGLYLLKKNEGKWDIVKKYKSFDQSSRVMAFDQNQRLWMTHGYKGVFGFDFSSDYLEITKTEFYGQESGFPSNILINVFVIDNNLVFAAERDIYSYNNETNLFKIDSTYQNVFSAGDHVRELQEDSFNNVYFTSVAQTGIIKKDQWGKFTLQSDIFNKIHAYLNDDLENISIIDKDNILFATQDGFAHYNNDNSSYTSKPYNLLFRSVKLNDADTVLFGGNFTHDGKIVPSQPEYSIPQIQFQNNSIHFTYAAVTYDQIKSSYRYWLEGFDDEWSVWSDKSSKEYTNLPEGDYMFHIEAMDVFKTQSGIKTFAFKILPPWYRSKYAYVFYFLLALAFIYSSYKLNKKKYILEKNSLIDRQKQELEQKDNKLKEVAEQSQSEIQKLRTEKLKSEISHKNKELATSTMHLIDKNEFINSIKTHINDILKGADGKGLKTDLNRIVKDIDRNINADEDWQQFEMHFDQVHGDFLKRIQTDYSKITPQETKLCAYLRINMSTKEIANLLKISVRGVEIARYRLRKKLDLDKGINLNDFMMKY